jgi:hypothetical protein
LVSSVAPLLENGTAREGSLIVIGVLAASSDRKAQG